MATCPSVKIDSNVTGLRYAWERCLKELWPNPIWNVLEPNSYSDFGATVTTVARNPINPSRSRKKGTVTDLDAQGGFNQDLTQNNLTELAQSFFFANARQRGTTRPLNAPDTSVISVVSGTNTITIGNLGVATAVVAAGGTLYSVGQVLNVTGGTNAAATAVVRVATINPATGAVLTVTVEEKGQYGALPANPAATTTIGGAAGTGCTLTLTSSNNTTFLANELVKCSGFAVAANNGIKKITSMTVGALVVGAGTVADEASPPAAATVESVGWEFASADVSMVMNGNLGRLTSAAQNMALLGVNPGDWIFLGADVLANRFVNNVGFARVGAVAATYFELDKCDWTPVAEAGTGKTIRIYLGTVIKNESDPALIVRKTLQMERTLGQDLNGTMSEYLTGAIANELTLNAAQAAIATVDLTFVGCDVEQRTGLQGLKTGTRPALVATDAFNTTDNFNRIKLSLVDPTSSNPVALFAFCTDLTLTINNNVTPNKAIGILGAFDTTAGTFEVGGELTAYFADVAGPKAVRANSDVTVDYVLVKSNAGIVWDMPLIALGNGAIQIEADQPITLPLETNAAESKFGHTLLMESFNYLPDIAAL